MPATKVKRTRRLPSVGTYVTDAVRKELFRIEAIHRKDGVIMENCRSYFVFILTIKDYEKAGFVEVE